MKEPPKALMMLQAPLGQTHIPGMRTSNAKQLSGATSDTFPIFQWEGYVAEEMGNTDNFLAVLFFATSSQFLYSLWSASESLLGCGYQCQS